MAAADDTWVIMPCYNEEANLLASIRETKRFAENLVVVDDGSRDASFEIACRANRFNLRHAVNLGKGAALKTGAEYALQHGAKRLIFIDSDGQHEPLEIPRFLKALDSGYSIVFGSRKLDKNMPGIFRLGNYLLTSYIYILFGVRLKDTQSGYRAMTKEAYEKIRWKATDYSVESEMIANVGKSHLKYKEIEISTIYKNRHKGTTVLDGIKIAVYMSLFWLRR